MRDRSPFRLGTKFCLIRIRHPRHSGAAWISCGRSSWLIKRTKKLSRRHCNETFMETFLALAIFSYSLWEVFAPNPFSHILFGRSSPQTQEALIRQMNHQARFRSSRVTTPTVREEQKKEKKQELRRRRNRRPQRRHHRQP